MVYHLLKNAFKVLPLTQGPLQQSQPTLCPSANLVLFSLLITLSPCSSHPAVQGTCQTPHRGSTCFLPETFDHFFFFSFTLNFPNEKVPDIVFQMTISSHILSIFCALLFSMVLIYLPPMRNGAGLVVLIFFFVYH